MTTRGLRVRTPRKRKVWATEENLQTAGVQLSAGDVEVAADLLAGYKSDRGITKVDAVTSMRIIGRLFLGNASSATAANFGFVPWGIAWVSDKIASASAGDAQLPSPNHEGAREVTWIQRGVLAGVSLAGSANLFANTGQLEGTAQLDITQMRKQPTPDYELVLITENGFSATEDATLHFQLSTMLALP